MLPVKVIWDYAYYWGVLCQLVFQQRLGDAALFADLARGAGDARSRSTSACSSSSGAGTPARRRATRAAMLDQRELPWFAEMNATLHDPLDDAGVRARLRENVALLEGLAATIVERAAADGGDALRGEMGDLARARLRPALFAAA